jgi:hypothetical protein
LVERTRLPTASGQIPQAWIMCKSPVSASMAFSTATRVSIVLSDLSSNSEVWSEDHSSPRLRALLSSAGRLVITVGAVIGFDQLMAAYNFDIRANGVTPLLLVSIVLNLWLSVECLLLIANGRLIKFVKNESPSSPEDFGKSIIYYADSLINEKKFGAAVSLWRNISRTLHLMGLHQFRVYLGERVLEAAIKCGDDVARAEILIDDLGWARHLLGERKEAEESIASGIELAKGLASSARSELQRIEAIRIQAKGLRHLAIIIEDSTSASKMTLAQKILREAITSASADPALHSLRSALRADLAQLSHANAVLVAKKYNLLDAGLISNQIPKQKSDIESALSDVLSAGKIFEELGDLERYAKTLNLSIRLQDSLGRKLESRQTMVKRDHVISISGVSDPKNYLRI